MKDKKEFIAMNFSNERMWDDPSEPNERNENGKSESNENEQSEEEQDQPNHMKCNEELTANDEQNENNSEKRFDRLV
jgi:hypothetical protein